jgi:hypothetical protein
VSDDQATEPADDDADDYDEPPAARQALDFLLANPARVFAFLGILVFTLGWAAIVYIMIDPGRFTFAEYGTQGRMQLALQYGTGVTTASALLWGVASFVWSRTTTAPRQASDQLQ